MLPHSFTITMRMEDGRKFSGRNTFISELEALTLGFYGSALSKVRAWQAPAPQMKREDADDAIVQRDVL